MPSEPLCKCGHDEPTHRVQIGREPNQVFHGCYVCQDCERFEPAPAPAAPVCMFCGKEGAADCGEHGKVPGPPSPPKFFSCCGGSLSIMRGGHKPGCNREPAPAAPADGWPQTALTLLHGIYPRYFQSVAGAHLTEDEAVQFAEEYARLKVDGRDTELAALRRELVERDGLLANSFQAHANTVKQLEGVESEATALREQVKALREALGDLVKALREALGDLIELANAAMADANRLGSDSEFDREIELSEYRELLAALWGAETKQ